MKHLVEMSLSIKYNKLNFLKKLYKIREIYYIKFNNLVKFSNNN